MKRLALFTLCLVAALPPAASAQNKRPMQVDDLFRFQRVADPQISPDGKLVAYVVTRVDLAGNKTSSGIWLAPTDKGEPRPLTNSGKKDRHPRWSPDGKRILFESNRGGDFQLWVIDLDGGEARQLTNISTEASNAIWSRDGRQIAFVSAVWPEYSDKPFKESEALNRQRKEEQEKSPVKAKVFTRLFYRHWDEYVEDKRQHLFVIPFEPARSASEGFAEPKDVTPGDRDAFPTSDTFSTGDNFTFSPDGKYLVFTAPPEKNEAWSTNYDICRVPVTGGTTKWENLTADNAAADSGPQFSRDGKKLAWRAQKKAGYEADKWDIVVADVKPDGALAGPVSRATAGTSLSVDEFVFSPPLCDFLFVAEERAASPIFFLPPLPPEPQRRSREGEGKASNLTVVGALPLRASFLRSSLNAPPEVWVKLPHTDGFNLSKANAKLLAELDLPRPESVTVKGAGGTPMQMWILKPPGFDPKKKYPLVYLVHGGPQGAWQDGWSYRWNPQLWAAQGYVVALPNPRGSTGFGQKYVEEISGDWGGKCYEDLLKGLDYLEAQPYIDKERMAAAGASFGGYMMNWFAVNTGRFKCLISHCGVWNFESMWGTTDELWFDEYEHGGLPWEVPGKYAEFSPHKKAANLAKFKTPMLLIQNDLDFRCPVGQGHELFSALQRQGVPSRMINFPDEGHWVLKPKNSEYWHKEVFAWLKKYAPPGGR